MGLWQGWSTAQRQLRLERNARLLSDLRNLSPSASLPPPVEEAWIAQLPPLPALPAALEPATSSAQPQPALPELVGVVQIPGQRGSAIFQQGASSSNALVGEQIGGSGWRCFADVDFDRLLQLRCRGAVGMEDPIHHLLGLELPVGPGGVGGAESAHTGQRCR